MTDAPTTTAAPATSPATGPGSQPQGVPAPGVLANLPNSERPEVQIGAAFAGGILAALILKRVVS